MDTNKRKRIHQRKVSLFLLISLSQAHRFLLLLLSLPFLALHSRSDFCEWYCTEEGDS